ncbi:hypothetical protein [Actinomadura decatromicini]|uniref:Uncharacterized protein n=1 Tax=Actinomadura decatromicini TaxID=2604572 RepID=A0A5D3FB34_9ACTN|nr:hypothetical protein [Actinomadura decatromicini]TYK45148.1 hypothetical protein FXF68_31195 [Actinomadura decatromicini]
MARHWFGQSPSDWTFSVDAGDGVVLAGSVTVTLWNAAAGGTQYTDLLDAAGTPITEVVTGDGSTLPKGTIPQFQGPDGIGELWADAGGGIRYRLTPTDLGGDVVELQSAVADLTTTVTALTTMVQNSGGMVVYNAATSSWPQRPAGDSRLFQWVGPSVPTAGTPYMEEGDLWVNTSAA